MNIYVTHYKKLSGVRETVLDFLKIVGHLKHKLKCVLFQFPSNFHFNEENLSRLKQLKTYLKLKIDYAFELCGI